MKFTTPVTQVFSIRPCREAAMNNYCKALLFIGVCVAISLFCAGLVIAEDDLGHHLEETIAEPPSGAQSLEALRLGHRDDTPPEFRVELFGEHYYKKKFMTTGLYHGQRMFKIRRLKQFPKSIHLGSKVGVIVFFGEEYHSDYFRISKYIQPPLPGAKKIPTKMWFLPYKRADFSTPVFWEKHREKASLIVYRKDINDFLGVFFGDRFYGLPEDAGQKNAIHHKIQKIYQEKAELGLIPKLRIIAGGQSSDIKDIRIMVTGSAGVRQLPQDAKWEYQISKLGIGWVSSIRIDYLGSVTKQSYLPLTSHKAPPAPDKEKPVQVVEGVFDMSPEAGEGPGRHQAEIRHHDHAIPEIGGLWESSINRIYHIFQEGPDFEWGVQGSDERGNGQITGKTIHVKWQGEHGHGKAEGMVTDFDGEHRAIRIEWNNGVVFFRE